MAEHLVLIDISAADDVELAIKLRPISDESGSLIFFSGRGLPLAKLSSRSVFMHGGSGESSEEEEEEEE